MILLALRRIAAQSTIKPERSPRGIFATHKAEYMDESLLRILCTVILVSLHAVYFSGSNADHDRHAKSPKMHLFI